MSRWWRAEDTSIDHPKLLKLSDAMHRAWYTLMCVASANDGVLPPTEDIAVRLREKPAKVAAWIAHLVSAGLFDNDDGVFRPHNWNKRQYKSDVTDPTAAERMRRYRTNKRNARNAAVTALRPEAETEAETEAEQSAGAVELGSKESDLQRRLGEAFNHVGSAIPDLGRASAWLTKGYDPFMVIEVVRELLARKPDIASLGYFESALADRHKRRSLAPSERNPVDLEEAVKCFARTRVWIRGAPGNEPGLPGCRAPADMLARHGLDERGQKLLKAS